jgi:tRNA(Ile2) C34 agmatinyltransferase TiaS
VDVWDLELSGDTTEIHFGVSPIHSTVSLSHGHVITSFYSIDGEHRRVSVRDFESEFKVAIDWLSAKHMFGFGLLTLHPNSHVYGWDSVQKIWFPTWIGIVLSFSPLMILLVERSFRRRPPCQCRRCGYDLRATPDRCPECGTVVPASRLAKSLE